MIFRKSVILMKILSFSCSGASKHQEFHWFYKGSAGGGGKCQKIEIYGIFMNFIILAKKWKFHPKVEISRFCASGRLATASTATAKVQNTFRAGRGEIAKNDLQHPTFLFWKNVAKVKIGNDHFLGA